MSARSTAASAPTLEVAKLNGYLSACSLPGCTACSAIRDRLRLLEGAADLSDAAVREELTEKRASGLVGRRG